jgi:hypothetical protein
MVSNFVVEIEKLKGDICGKVFEAVRATQRLEAIRVTSLRPEERRAYDTCKLRPLYYCTKVTDTVHCASLDDLLYMEMVLCDIPPGPLFLAIVMSF